MYALVDKTTGLILGFSSTPIQGWLPLEDRREPLTAGARYAVPSYEITETKVIRKWGKAQLKPEDELELVRNLRKAQYPSIGDQLDAAFKARNGDTAQQEEIDAKIACVKASFPKPTGF